MTTRTLALPRRLPRLRRGAGRTGGLGPAARRALLVLAVIVALLAAGFLVLRESSLVAVQDITITGPTGQTAGPVRSALTSAARDMTTLSYDREALLTAVEPYPIVKDVRVTTDFPRGMSIEVVEHVPVAAVKLDGRTVAVAGNGTILRGAGARDLPVLPLRSAPAGARVDDPVGRVLVRSLAAAPAPLLERIAEVRGTGRGVEVSLTAGPDVYLGGIDRLEAKWAAVASVLADASSRGATYIDVRLPERPAAGGLEQAAIQQRQTEAAGSTAAPETNTSPGATAPPPSPDGVPGSTAPGGP